MARFVLLLCVFCCLWLSLSALTTFHSRTSFSRFQQQHGSSIHRNFLNTNTLSTKFHKQMNIYSTGTDVHVSGPSTDTSSQQSWVENIKEQLQVVWDFTRPHTIVGSCVSIVCLFLFAVPSCLWKEPLFHQSMAASLIPALFMNLYITGLNQVTDVEIDKINKPYLPIAAGRLSKSNGIAIVLGSLFLSLCNIHKAAWPLKSTLLGSALLGTAYSLPPFRLKRFPLLAAFCILVVRGSLVNLGFFLQAKSVVLGESIPVPTWNLFSLMNIGKIYPEAAIVTGFFAIFGLVIALMKDVPDIRGDIEYKIPSFSVKLGAKRMFRISKNILVGLLLMASATTLWSSQVFSSLWSAPITTTSGGAIAGLVGTVSSSSRLSPVSQCWRVVLSAVLGGCAWDVRKRARKVEADSPERVFDFYMYIWNIFYLCYFLLPVLRI